MKLEKHAFKKSASLNKYLIATLLLSSFFGWAPVAMANSVDSCQSRLTNSGNLSGTTAAKFCQKDSSEKFISCQIRLTNSGNLSGDAAASFCLKNPSQEVLSCQSRLTNSGGLSGDAAAFYCKLNSSREFTSCVLHENNYNQRSGNTAAPYCLVATFKLSNETSKLASSDLRSKLSKNSDIKTKAASHPGFVGEQIALPANNAAVAK
jgi:hypothetical protein